MAAWLSGTGSVPLYNLMEDAATAEISRAQNWQWIHHGAILDGEVLPVKVTLNLFHDVLQDELSMIQKKVGNDKFVTGNFLVSLLPNIIP